MRGTTQLVSALRLPFWPPLLPHGGGGVAVVVAALGGAVIGTIIALELRRTHVFAWALTALVATYLVVGGLHAILTAPHHH